jgi:hypothetical protein
VAVNGNGNSGGWEEGLAAPYPDDLPPPVHNAVLVAIHHSIDYVCIGLPGGELLAVVPAEAWLEVADELESRFEA